MYYYGTYRRLGVHIYASNREVIRAAQKKLHPIFHYDRDVREQRHRFYREILSQHHQARAIAEEFRL